MRVAEFFAGIGGFRLGLERAGHEVAYSCEIDRFARRVYRRRFGALPTSRDVTRIDPATIPDCDLWCAGSPCQGFSTAGKRTGLEDARSGLVLRFLELAEIRKTEWILLENVPGLLSGKDNACGRCDALVGIPAGDDSALCACGDEVVRADSVTVPWIGTLLGTLAERGYERWAYRVLDAQ